MPSPPTPPRAPIERHLEAVHRASTRLRALLRPADMAQALVGVLEDALDYERAMPGMAPEDFPPVPPGGGEGAPAGPSSGGGVARRPGGGVGRIVERARRATRLPERPRAVERIESPSTVTGRLLRVAAAGLASALSLAGCRRGASPSSDTVVIGQVTSAVSLDPHLHDEESTHSALSHFYERLVAFGPELELRPELATAWANPSDTVWRFILRDGVRFHDGTAFAAPDVVASLDRALRLPGSQVAHYLQNVVEVKATGPLSVEVVTSAPSPLLLHKLAFVAIVPRSTPMQPISRPVGTGPYRFVSGTAREALQGRAFEAYWGPRPAFNGVRVVPLPDAAGRAHAVAERKADVVVRFPFDFAPWARGQKGMQLVSRPGLGVGFLCFSVRKGSRFADPRVREAFGLSIDRARLLDEAERPYTALAEQFVPRTVFGYTPPARPWSHDPARGRALLAEAGFPSGLDVTLVTPDTQASLGERLAPMLAEAGIRVRLEAPPWDTVYARWSSGELELFTFAYTCGTGDASDLLDSFFRTRGPSAGTLNGGGYSNERFDRLVEEAGRVLDPDVRRRLMGEALALLRNDLPAIPLLSRGYLYSVGDAVAWTPRMDRRVRAQDMRPRGAS